MATHVNVHPAQMRFGGLRAAPDRTRAFSAARRHSVVVKLLKLSLPVAALSVAALYILPSRLAVPIKGGEASVEALDLTSSDGLKMVNPRIKGVHDKYGVYDIRADSALQHVKEPEVMTFDAITADIVSSQGEKTTLTAPSGIFHSKKEEMTFDSGVTIGGEAGIAGTMKTATAYMKENRLISQDPLTLTYHGHTIASDSVEIWTSQNRAIFTGNVRVHLERAETEGKQQ